MTRKTFLEDTTPSLVVRGPNCLLCHANIGVRPNGTTVGQTSNLVTDLGYGDPWALGGTYGIGSGWYGHLAAEGPNGTHEGGWQSIQRLNGSVIIPDVSVSATQYPRLFQSARISTPTSTLTDILTSPYQGPLNWLDPAEPSSGNVTPMVDTTKMGIETRKQIIIRPPSDAQMRQHIARLGSNSGGVFSGFQLRPGTNSGRPYLELTGNVTCKGSYFTDRAILMRNVTLATDENGCSLYTSGNIFIQSKIRYSGTSPKEHLQLITSAGIFMGFSPETLRTRLLNEAFVTAHTRASPNGLLWDGSIGPNTPPARIKLIEESLSFWDKMIDANGGDTLNTPVVIDRDNLSSSGPTQELSTERAVVNFEHVLFVSSEFHSRFLGHIYGSVVAEIALGAVGHFRFEYDPLLSSIQPFIAWRGDSIVEIWK